MALKAGYYGVKKNVLDELNKLDGILPANVSKTNKLATQTEINNIWTGQLKNYLPYPYTNRGNKTDNGITFVDNGDGTITVKPGTASANAQYYIAGSSSDITRPVTDLSGKYFSKGFVSTAITLIVWYYDTSKNYISSQGATEKGAAFVIPENAVYYAILIRVNSGTVVSSDVVVKPMISDAGGDYYPFALSNQKLTISAADQDAAIADHKTTINAIIAAATGAADFAAFKTAMAAITPVTRSIISQDSFEVIEEPIETKTTTKKSAKKTSTE